MAWRRIAVPLSSSGVQRQRLRVAGGAGAKRERLQGGQGAERVQLFLVRILAAFLADSTNTRPVCPARARRHGPVSRLQALQLALAADSIPNTLALSPLRWMQWLQLSLAGDAAMEGRKQ